MKNNQPSNHSKVKPLKPLNLDKTELSMAICFSDRHNINRNGQSRNNKTPVKSKTMAQFEYGDEQYSDPNLTAVNKSSN